MPNPQIPPQSWNSGPEPSPENGILRLIPGDVVGGGASELPPAGPGEAGEPRRQVQALVPELGTVVLTYELKRNRRSGRSENWFWVAVRADLVSSE